MSSSLDEDKGNISTIFLLSTTKRQYQLSPFRIVPLFRRSQHLFHSRLIKITTWLVYTKTHYMAFIIIYHYIGLATHPLDNLLWLMQYIIHSFTCHWHYILNLNKRDQWEIWALISFSSKNAKELNQRTLAWKALLIEQSNLYHFI